MPFYLISLVLGGMKLNAIDSFLHPSIFTSVVVLMEATGLEMVNFVRIFVFLTDFFALVLPAIFAEDNLSKKGKIYKRKLRLVYHFKSESADNQAEIVEESIKHAKEAIMLDVKDGNSWCKAFHGKMHCCQIGIRIVYCFLIFLNRVSHDIFTYTPTYSVLISLTSSKRAVLFLDAKYLLLQHPLSFRTYFIVKKEEERKSVDLPLTVVIYNQLCLTKKVATIIFIMLVNTAPQVGNFVKTYRYICFNSVTLCFKFAGLRRSKLSQLCRYNSHSSHKDLLWNHNNNSLTSLRLSKVRPTPKRESFVYFLVWYSLGYDGIMSGRQELANCRDKGRLGLQPPWSLVFNSLPRVSFSHTSFLALKETTF
ncbi:hypothetical protein HYC85_021513 [Camellia sinensis]|uniref:Uncharacterized protein n=1 Tax=Camellia sinensis TaxID=4442 RepID=A0A7J7GLP7_CAMSI|nr:hypothetical protein HYC85_021513 [Camellia sinensis]